MVGTIARRLVTKIALRAAIGMTPAAVIGDVKVIDLRGELPRREGVQYAQRPESKITGLVWHHTAGPEQQPLHSIAEYHVRVRRWPGIGYHFAIDSDGAVFQMQAVTTVSYHAYMNNTANIGIVLIGDYDKAQPSEKMRRSVAALMAFLKKRYSTSHVYLHREIKATACPGRYGARMVRELR